MRRGPGCKDGRFKLEGIGGGVEETDSNFREALKREISEEVGMEANISIKKFLYARTEEVYDLHKKENKFWIILSYIGTLESGELQIKEKTKNLGYERYLINEIDIKELTDCAKSAYEKILNNWKEIEKSIMEELSMNKLYFMKKFRPEELCIKEFKYWIVCVRQKQTTLGDVVILLKRETQNVSGMLPEEGAEFLEVIKWYEELCREKFGAIKFNYMIMMMHDPFVHYHAFPRYDKVVNLFNIDWKDNNTLSNFASTETLDDELLFKIRDYMK